MPIMIWAVTIALSALLVGLTVGVGPEQQGFDTDEDANGPGSLGQDLYAEYEPPPPPPPPSSSFSLSYISRVAHKDPTDIYYPQSVSPSDSPDLSDSPPQRSSYRPTILPSIILPNPQRRSSLRDLAASRPPPRLFQIFFVPPAPPSTIKQDGGVEPFRPVPIIYEHPLRTIDVPNRRRTYQERFARFILASAFTIDNSPPSSPPLPPDTPEPPPLEAPSKNPHSFNPSWAAGTVDRIGKLGSTRPAALGASNYASPAGSGVITSDQIQGVELPEFSGSSRAGMRPPAAPPSRSSATRPSLNGNSQPGVVSSAQFQSLSFPEDSRSSSRF